MMKQKNLNICRRSKLSNMVKSDGEPVSGTTLRTVIDDDDGGGGDWFKILKWYITINSKTCYINAGIYIRVSYGTGDNILNATNIPFSICCVAEHLVKEYKISEPTVGHNNKYS